MVDALENSGYLVRTQDPADRRRHLLYLTDAGDELMETILATVVGEREALFKGISNAEIEQLQSVLARIDANIIG